MVKGADKIGAPWHPEVNGWDVPRYLCWQLDAMVEKYLEHLETHIIQRVEQTVFPKPNTKRHPEDWLSVLLAAYICLATLESDAWNLRTWDLRAQRWKDDPELSTNPVRCLPYVTSGIANDQQTLVWPLGEASPESMYKQNEHQARQLVAHMRAISKGRAPFRGMNGSRKQQPTPNTKNPDKSSLDLAASIVTDVMELCKCYQNMSG